MKKTLHDVHWVHVPGTTCHGRLICEYVDHWELRCIYCGQHFTPAQSVVDMTCTTREQLERVP